MSFNNANLLATGSKDHTIALWDLRQSAVVSELKLHRQEICGLVWNPNENVLASGGNDNCVVLYNLQAAQVQGKLKEHRAAVRALDWSPHQNGVLISGGGTKDQQICVWNTLTDTLVNKIKVDSQVCKLRFSQNSNEFVSTHGFEQNEIVIWKYKELQKEAVLHGHEQRVLQLALSPDGQTIATGAGDETLKFWKVFPPQKQGLQSTLSFSISDLR